MSKTGDGDVNVLFEKIRIASTNKLGGLVLKTYDSDIFNNWVKTDWIDGENGISKVTALKPDEDGTITITSAQPGTKSLQYVKPNCNIRRYIQRLVGNGLYYRTIYRETRNANL